MLQDNGEVKSKRAMDFNDGLMETGTKGSGETTYQTGMAHFGIRTVNNTRVGKHSPFK